MDISKYEVPADKLRWQCDPCLFEFDCTKGLAPLKEFIGQERAIRAIEFGLNMNHDGYNIYVAGLTGTGKTTVVKTYIEKLIAERQAQGLSNQCDDWCYLYNFVDQDRPVIANLPRGKGKDFRQDVSDVLHKLRETLAKTFSSKEYQDQRRAATEEGQAMQQRLFKQMEIEAEERGFNIQITPVGPSVVPVRNGKALSQADFANLPEKERKKIEENIPDLMKKLQATLEKAREIDISTAEKLEQMDRDTADMMLSRLFEGILNTYTFSPVLTEYLDGLKAHTLSNLELFKEVKEKDEQPLSRMPGMQVPGQDPDMPFRVNLFVDNSASHGPPVIVESNPNYTNLFGMIERRFLWGGYLTDHTMLKAGALQMANDGYLVLSTRDVLMNPGVWAALKRAIKTKEARIEDPLEAFGMMAPQGLRPQPMPVNVKVVLIGDGSLYQALSFYDEDFWETFKIKADFNFEVDRTDENILSYASFIAGFCEEGGEHHFDRTGVAKVVEYAARMVNDQERLSTRFAWIKELIKEAEYWATKESAELVSARHVERALYEWRFRHNLPSSRIRDMIRSGTIMIDVDGAVVGQVNGLSVYQLGDITFGKPSRITCTTFLGRGGLINIERESRLSGSIHDKGILILSGLLGDRYAQDNQLSLSASLCFEQSYEGIDGDSASVAEFCTIISSLSRIPLNQSIAVTGSINQLGEVQPIGAINYKIEGYYSVCKAMGLTGRQGVLMPRRNLRNLMLREEIVEAVKNGLFHIYCVDTVDQAIEVLTGKRAGARRKDGTYPRGTVNHEASARLRDMAAKLKEASKTRKTKAKEEPAKA